MSLVPLAAQPSLQREGFGQQLVREGIQRVSNGVLRLILVFTEPDYYPKFGFVPAAEYMLEWPGFIETECFQLCELLGGILVGLQRRFLRFVPSRCRTDMI